MERMVTVEDRIKTAVPGETPAQLMARCQQAKRIKMPYIEADRATLDFIMVPDGMGDQTSIIYADMRVFVPGVAESTLRKESMDMHNKMHNEKSYFEGRSKA